MRYRKFLKAVVLLRRIARKLVALGAVLVGSFLAFIFVSGEDEQLAMQEDEMAEMQEGAEQEEAAEGEEELAEGEEAVAEGEEAVAEGEGEGELPKVKVN